MPKKRVVVKIEFGVEGNDLVIRRNNQRVYFCKRGVCLPERVEKQAKKASTFCGLSRVEIELTHHFNRFGFRQAKFRINKLLEYFFGVSGRNFLNLGPAFRTRHYHDTL